ncbi:SDR family NAD(P)-dependent oxidoreductase [Paenibacillus oenotherae]|uniref:SDR family NAD(P)-dependent oxidoreductase n=1 Tax=Paenibacillus oenotherae TaxID=1435645 RepID=A0ABS7D564_9BACL|nr:type I polyketide synthase [Paenibacillus oenotherae]MBW7475087.1 SDR family NAD(P)-dependent oxidoreductase [Paenibacillus oenotherae]
MAIDWIDLPDLQEDHKLFGETGQPMELHNRDIAIIGISGRIGHLENIADIWEFLSTGQDGIRPLSSERHQDIADYMKAKGVHAHTYNRGSYFNEIDKFDYRLFSLSPMEAGLMDPNQRIFLETAWSAIEDAGYMNRIKGSRTGIFAGFSGDFGGDYKEWVQQFAPSLKGVSTAGNIKSIIASRIAYLLDLKGPSLLVDTACSSSLVAVHLACKSLQHRECEMALVGSIKVNLCPVAEDTLREIGIQSSDFKTRTFDHQSTGTGFGEGAFAILLKPLHKALEDQDHIHAVIKGSAVNQDGMSIGVTAPNALSQEDVLLRAWEDAGVDPETVSYIEAHGTGTKLGDPIEVQAIHHAFDRHTAKRGFCAIGSIKSNVGHLDHAAGLAGLLKVVCALKHRTLPATLHFRRSNSAIHFIDSALYVNDRPQAWDAAIRRAGVSAFGLSGTNCHVVLEEPPQMAQTCSDGPGVATISALSKKGIASMIGKLDEWVRSNPAVDVENLCYTLNTGRKHFNHRLAVVFSNRLELSDKLRDLIKHGVDAGIEGCHFASYKLVGLKKKTAAAGEITEETIRGLAREADLLIQDNSELRDIGFLGALSELYIQGADIAWTSVYPANSGRILPLPTYPFDKQRVWLPSNEPHGAVPEIRRITSSVDGDIYETELNADRHWILSEHQVEESFVVPGTAYLDMIRTIMMTTEEVLANQYVRFENVLFVKPFALQRDQAKVLQILIRHKGAMKTFTVASQSLDGSWDIHAEGGVMLADPVSIPGRVDLNGMMHDANPIPLNDENLVSAKEVITGKRWDNMVGIYEKGSVVLSHLKLREELAGDLEHYAVHPALMDNAVHLSMNSGKQHLYLPWSYKAIHMYKPFPGEIYSLMSKVKENEETATFNIGIVDAEGEPVAGIEQYSMKKVYSRKAGPHSGDGKFYGVNWVSKALQGNTKSIADKVFIILLDGKGIGHALAEALHICGARIVKVRYGEAFDRLPDGTFTMRPVESDCIRLLEQFKETELGGIIHLASIAADAEWAALDGLNGSVETMIEGLFHLGRVLAKRKARVDLSLITQHANAIDKEEKAANDAIASSLIGLARVIGQENSHIVCRSLDIGSSFKIEQILPELITDHADYEVVLRDDQRRTPCLKPVLIEEASLKPDLYREGGVYVITGGLGGLGLEIARHISSGRRLRIALISRNAASVPHHLPEHPASRILNAIEQGGSEVRKYSADISDEQAVTAVLDRIRVELGPISGIFHAAGVAGDGILVRKEMSAFQEVLAPKIRGTWLLDRYTDHDPIDFTVLFSSVTSLLGGVGQGDYTCANAFMDAYAAGSANKGRRMLSIHWPPWKETGMAVNYGANHDRGLFKAIATGDALTAMDSAIASPYSRLIIGELNTAPDGEYVRFNYGINTVPVAAEAPLSSEMKEQGKPSGQTPAAVGERAVKEGRKHSRSIADDIRDAWQTVLGLPEFDDEDTFSDLGGDSIIATRLLKELNHYFPGVFDITDMFTYSSVKEMTDYVASTVQENLGPSDSQASQSNQSADPHDDIDLLLARLAEGEIAASEAEQLFRAHKRDNKQM